MKYATPSFLLMSLWLSGCVWVNEPPRLEPIQSFSIGTPHKRIAATASAPQSLEQGRLDSQRLQQEQDRLDRLARSALGATNLKAPNGLELRRILFRPGASERIEYAQIYRGIALRSSPLAVEIENGRVVSIEGERHLLEEDFSIKPVIDAPSAEELARIYTNALPNAEAVSELVLLPDEERPDDYHLAWQIDLPRQRVWIDAGNGRMLDHERRQGASE